jgi:hypothetical protein
LPPSQFIMVAKLSCGELNDKERNRKIKQAEIEEILLRFAMLCGLMPIMKEEIKGITALTCHLLKSRLWMKGSL